MAITQLQTYKCVVAREGELAICGDNVYEVMHRNQKDGTIYGALWNRGKMPKREHSIILESMGFDSFFHDDFQLIKLDFLNVWQRSALGMAIPKDLPMVNLHLEAYPGEDHQMIDARTLVFEAHHQGPLTVDSSTISPRHCVIDELRKEALVVYQKGEVYTWSQVGQNVYAALQFGQFHSILFKNVKVLHSD